MGPEQKAGTSHRCHRYLVQHCDILMLTGLFCLRNLNSKPPKKDNNGSPSTGILLKPSDHGLCGTGTLIKRPEDAAVTATPHIDDHQLRTLQATEEQERALLRQISTFAKQNGEQALRERLSV